MPDPKTPAAKRPRASKSATPPPDAAPAGLPDAVARHLLHDHAIRVVVEQVKPEIDAGRFPIKRTPGEPVVVTAVVLVDGHEVLAGVVRHRNLPAGSGDDVPWQETPLESLGNDGWRASFTVGAIGAAEYTVEAWIDHFATWRKGFAAKVGAGQDVSSELLEGAVLLKDAATRAADGVYLLEQAAILGGDAPAASRIAAALAPALAVSASAAADRARGTRYARVLRVTVDRERARFGAWYEMFPRSAGSDPTRSATFREAEARLHAIAAMGFDVVYLPPIHPIGRTFRKGPNNTLQAGPNDPGSPWAIGSDEGGHMSVEPGLGTLDDFDHFEAAARACGLEIALDLAYQCSPDHPYVREHPEWFRHRPDGTIKYAENPPKKYQDIYPFDFECAEWRSLWEELKRIVEFWCAHGVRIFRVDNPHTKSFHFWEWTIADVRRQYPDVIFLAEAFTRPNVMRYLAKLGFDQSYSYFTWRNARPEIVEYFTELSQTEVVDYMRPNLFANTPDILHEFLQHGGPAAFRIRLVLAATLGATYGIYSGFELCENVPVRPGSEEYLDSEKYQIKIRDWHAPHSLAPLVTRLNQLRREHSALQHDRGLRFFGSDNAAIVCYAKSSADLRDIVLVVVNLDPHNMQHGFVQAPLGDVQTSPGGAFVTEDLVTGAQFVWKGEWNYVRLSPDHPMHVLRLPAKAARGGVA
jgi:starch synthase (maltosyl-transferring)